MPGHEAIEQRRIEPVQIGERVGDGEGGLEIEMQRAVAKRRKIDQSRAVMNGVQGQGEIDGDGGGAAAALGIDNGEDLAAGRFAPGLAAGGGEANEGFEQIVGGRWAARCIRGRRRAWR